MAKYVNPVYFNYWFKAAYNRLVNRSYPSDPAMARALKYRVVLFICHGKELLLVLLFSNDFTTCICLLLTWCALGGVFYLVLDSGTKAT